MEKLNIAVVVNWQYVRQLETTLKSIFYSNKDVDVYVINPDLPQEWFRQINHQVGALGGHVIDRKFDPAELPAANQSADRPSTAGARILIPRLIPTSRVLYLDADVVVCGPLQSLFEMNLDGHPLAAVTDWLYTNDFNAGVMVMDLAAIRQQHDIVHQMQHFYATVGIPNDDQSVLNHYFGGSNYCRLPFRDNLQMGKEEVVKNYKDNHVPGASEKLIAIRQAMKQLTQGLIIHYTGDSKPWDITSACHQRNLWWQFANMTWLAIRNRDALPITHHSFAREVFTYTYTDQLFKLTKLIRDFPQILFTIATPGVFNDHWNRLVRFPNVRLIPIIMPDQLKRLKQSTQVYLDITQIDESYKGTDVIAAFLDADCPVFSFTNTQTPSLVNHANYHTFDNVQQFEDQLFKQLIK